MSLLKKLSNAAFVLNCLKIIGLLMGIVTQAPLLVPRTRCRARCCRPCRRTGLTEQVHEAPGSAAAFLRQVVTKCLEQAEILNQSVRVIEGMAGGSGTEDTTDMATGTNQNYYNIFET
ncbi:unnamed protein product [Plutella xylostella]|uniref:(diamondback moth) hypothetical protein n=1 Tax=Plutella xylostella TaxID=51655 RepID=A0A8S4FTM7_PLUXY|nr:unnamed protein product [Plutella xylostella]